MGIMLEMVNVVQQVWCDGFVRVSQIYWFGGQVKVVVLVMIDDFYDYKNGVVFFKFMLVQGKNIFCVIYKGVFFYFVGGDFDFFEDMGFVLKGWDKVWYDNNVVENGIQIYGDIVIIMGNVYFVDVDGNEIMVDKIFVFWLCEDGKLWFCVYKFVFFYVFVE